MNAERGRGLASIWVIVVVALIGGSAGAPLAVFAEPALPGVSCGIDSLQGWTSPEQWAWTEICEGRTVDFNRYLNETLDPGDPSHLGKWRDARRRLRPVFLETVLLYEPFRSAAHFHGVRILGAYVQGDVNLSGGVIERFLVFHGSFFDGSVAMRRLSTRTALSLNNTWARARSTWIHPRSGGACPSRTRHWPTWSWEGQRSAINSR